MKIIKIWWRKTKSSKFNSWRKKMTRSSWASKFSTSKGKDKFSKKSMINLKLKWKSRRGQRLITKKCCRKTCEGLKKTHSLIRAGLLLRRLGCSSVHNQGCQHSTTAKNFRPLPQCQRCKERKVQLMDYKTCRSKIISSKWHKTTSSYLQMRRENWEWLKRKSLMNLRGKHSWRNIWGAVSRMSKLKLRRRKLKQVKVNKVQAKSRQARKNKIKFLKCCFLKRGYWPCCTTKRSRPSSIQAILRCKA